MRPRPDPKTTCPHTGHKKKCERFFENCPHWTVVDGTDMYGCAPTVGVMMQLHQARSIVGLQEAVESARNLATKDSERLSRLIATDLNSRHLGRAQ